MAQAKLRRANRSNVNADRPANVFTSMLIRTVDELLNLLDDLVSNDDGWWNGFFSDQTRSCPFFVDWPDETLANDFSQNIVPPGRVLDLGCGNGRNAVFMAHRGCSVDAVDFSEAAIALATESALAAGQRVNYIQRSIFELDVVPGVYDMVYDSGCFHHVAPHRRETYVKLVSTALKPGGVLSMVCFGPEDGSGLTDLQVYERRTLGGGLGYSEQSLRKIFDSCFDIVDVRRMNEMRPSDKLFGKDFLRAIRMRKHGDSTARSR